MAEGEESIKVFVSGSCGPCQQVKKLIAEGKFNREKVDLIDIETDEGFPMIEKMGLQRVPTAMKGTQQCELLLEDDILVIQCPGEELDAGPEPGE